MIKPKLILIFDAGFDQKFQMVLPLDEHVARDVIGISPPSNNFGDDLDWCLEKIRRREFRKGMFIAEAQRLGALMAERMEDAEGWHDVSRKEPARKELLGD